MGCSLPDRSCRPDKQLRDTLNNVWPKRGLARPRWDSFARLCRPNTDRFEKSPSSVEILRFDAHLVQQLDEFRTHSATDSPDLKHTFYTSSTDWMSFEPTVLQVNTRHGSHVTYATKHRVVAVNLRAGHGWNLVRPAFKLVSKWLRIHPEKVVSVARGASRGFPSTPRLAVSRLSPSDRMKNKSYENNGGTSAKLDLDLDPVGSSLLGTVSSLPRCIRDSTPAVTIGSDPRVLVQTPTSRLREKPCTVDDKPGALGLVLVIPDLDPDCADSVRSGSATSRVYFCLQTEARPRPRAPLLVKREAEQRTEEQANIRDIHKHPQTATNSHKQDQTGTSLYGPHMHRKHKKKVRRLELKFGNAVLSKLNCVKDQVSTALWVSHRLASFLDALRRKERKCVQDIRNSLRLPGEKGYTIRAVPKIR
ncbi:hypothetical protein RRG08_050590 [Elysia crispata]|uniref:Uncharacterized protein n=1 Tax=Elysia crispata TaxID=231223 RepID=A0AAE0Z6X9_9GAST|nr:hypothetical protein RRG08_050590 [Elysia crispata]